MGKKEALKARLKENNNNNTNNDMIANNNNNNIISYPPLQNKPTLHHILNEPHNKRSLPLFLIATAAMFSIPLLVFFICYYAPDDLYPGKSADVHTRLMYSGLGAVICIQVVAFSFIYCAWQEEKNEEWNTKKNKKH